MKGKCIIAVDQSTSATKVFLLDEKGKIQRRFSQSHQQFYPQSGWVEHDAGEIWRNVCQGISQVAEGVEEVVALALSNQRETTVFWDRETGEPLCKAVVWQDVRGEALCKELEDHASLVHNRTGLTLSPYFPAAKAACVLRADPSLRQKGKTGQLCIGTVDSYLVFRLTGGQVFQTDVSNASRTQLMRLDTTAWDEELCALFDIPMKCLPVIASSDAGFGSTRAKDVPVGIPITGVMGDSHAALFGQGCHRPGMAKATYGTGSSVMMNIGPNAMLSKNGLSTSVGYGFQGSICYVLEGNVTCSGDTLCWLRDEAGLVSDVAEAETLAATVADTEGVYLVPAFSGLGAPYSDGDARALLCGMHRGTNKAVIARAALESMAYQDGDIIIAMEEDTGKHLTELRVDGGPTKNQLVMQFQADILNCPIQCAAASELSALGVGYMAGMTTGLYQNLELLTVTKGDRYEPTKSAAWRKEKIDGWITAVGRCR